MGSSGAKIAHWRSSVLGRKVQALISPPCLANGAGYQKECDLNYYLIQSLGRNCPREHDYGLKAEVDHEGADSWRLQ